MSRLSRPAIWQASLLGLFFVSLYFLTGSSDLLHNGDTLLRYQTTQALVEHHRLWLDLPAYTDSRVTHGQGGHWYAFYGPGQVVVMVPFYIAGKVVAHHFGLPYDLATSYAARSLDLVLGALLAVLFFFFALIAGYPRRVAVLLTLLFGLATAAWPDAQSALEQTQVDLFLLVGVLGVVQFIRTDLQVRRWLILAACGVGLAFDTRYDALLYLPLLPAIVTAVRCRRHQIAAVGRDWGVFALASLPWIGVLALWNVIRFGSPFLTGLHEQTLGEPFLQGLASLTVSPGKGLIWYVPVLLLLPWTIRSFVDRDRFVAGFCAVLVVVPLVFYSNVLYWHGDPSWGPRYLYIALPYLVLPLGELFVRWQRLANHWRAVVLGVVAVSLGIQVCAVSVTQWRFWYRLQALQQQSADADQWSGQPFQWGAAHYQYYWTARESPLLIQVDNVYQVSRLLFTGAQRYYLSAQPDPYVHSNPAVLYPVNTFSFWWADTRHPLFGSRAREALAVLLGMLALLSLAALAASLRGPPGQVRRLNVETANPGLSRAGG